MTDRRDEMPRFVLEHIHRSGWTKFREVQERVFDVLFGTDHHLLIASSTSSGKIEAAFIPVVSSLHSDPPEGVGALYTGPTKALIDDQFSRLERMFRDSGVRVTDWHGDIDRGRKKGLKEESSGILQITPESLEDILDNHSETVERMFGGLRLVIIDEVHALMVSDRGGQLVCGLVCIGRMGGCKPRIIALSATLSEPGTATEWLSTSSDVLVDVVVSNDRPSCRIGIKYFQFPPWVQMGTGRGRVQILL